jgi:quercetin dioxygenase-like cupin family protein
MTQPRADRPHAATLAHHALTPLLERMRNEQPLEQFGRDSITLVRDDGLDVVLITLKLGGTLPEHRAPGPITVLVLEGRVAFSANGQRLEAGPHDLLTLEAHALHTVEALEPSALLVTIAAHKD